MVTLSCLIVEAGLYSQINSNMPASASPKAVDIFFFYNIARLFWVCLHHTIIDRWLACIKDEKNIENFNELKVVPAANKEQISPNRKIFVPEPSIYFTPNEEQTATNAWTATQAKGRNSRNEVNKFKKINIFSCIFYTLVDMSFIGSFVYWIIHHRNKISEEFNAA